MSHSASVATHTIQLFYNEQSRTDALVGFVRQGLEAGDTVLVVATREHWESATARLLQRGLRLDADIASYRLTVCNAAPMLDQLKTDHTVQRDRFDKVVAARVRHLRARGARVRAYGEMVDLLAAEGDFANVVRLEALWNELLLTDPMDLLCGYSATHLGHPRNTEALAQICDAHSHLRFSPHDKIGSHLLQIDADDTSSGTTH